jgi:DNA segregation ATPase FtsK/SpoIIIE-like protein
MSQVVGGVRRRVWVAAAAGVVVVAGTVAAVVSAGPDPVVEQVPDAQAVEMASVCVQAAQAKLQPLLTDWSGESTYERVDGTDWRVFTAVNHKTKWDDHWYDVTCVVGWTPPEAMVRSVETVAR